MRRTVLPILCFLALAGPASAEVTEGGRFGIFAGGREAGYETISITERRDRIVLSSRAELERGDRSQKLTLEIATDRETGEILTFAAHGVSGDVDRVVTLAKDGGELRGEIREGEMRRAITLPPRTLVVADPFFAPWLLLAARYDLPRGGAQEFPVLYPLEGETGTVTLRRREEEAIELDGRGELAIRILGKPDRGAVVNLWVDENGRLLVAARSVAGVSAVRGRRIRIGLKPGEDPPVPDGVASFRLRFEGPTAILAGTFSRPAEAEGPVPAVLLLAGSGPQDRSGNAPGTELQWNPLETIAMALASRGIASLRYDERGVARSGGSFGDASFSDFLADARAALSFLASREDVDPARIGIVGHSEGALLAARLAAEPGVAAIVLAGAPAEPLDRILLRQVRDRLVARGTSHAETWRILGDLRAYFEQVRLSHSDSVVWNGQVRPARWLREHLEISPLDVYRAVSVPALFVHGERDLQVPPDHARRGAEAAPRGEVRILPGLDHFLMESRDGLKDYADTRRRIQSGALGLIGDWLESRLAR